MVSSPSGVRKRVLVNFELEKNDSGDDQFDIFVMFIFSQFRIRNITRKLCYRKDDRAMRPTLWVP